MIYNFHSTSQVQSDFSRTPSHRWKILTSNRRSADIKTQSIDIPIELKWEMGISDNFDLFLGVGPSFSFLVDKDNWGRKLAHIAVDVIDKDLPSMASCLLPPILCLADWVNPIL